MKPCWIHLCIEQILKSMIMTGFKNISCESAKAASIGLLENGLEAIWRFISLLVDIVI